MSDLDKIVFGNDVRIHQGLINTHISPSVKRLLPPRLASTLYGRADMFLQVTKSLEAGEPVVLHGMAGMGKSALASVLAWAMLDKYPNGVLWIDCGYSPLDAICDSIGLQLEDEQMARLDVIAKPARVRYLLGNYYVLIVLDNVWDSDVARQFAQKCIPVGYNLLVTSREKIARLGTLLEVSSLSNEAGIDLFLDSSGVISPIRDPNIGKLVELLGGHPQGLTIAGALCLEEDLSVVELINMLGPAEARTKKLKLGEDTSYNVWATFDLSYQKLKPEEQIIFKAFGGSWAKSATTNILSLVVQATEDEVDTAVRGLVKRALVRSETLSEGRKRYVVHDLIHAFAQGIIAGSSRSIDDYRNDWLDACVKYAEAHTSDSIESHNALDLELGNLLGAAYWASENKKYKELDRLATGISCSDFLSRRGYNIQAVGLLVRAIDAAQSLQLRESEGKHYGNLGYAYALLSKYPSAIECYQKALDIAHSINETETESESEWYGLLGFTYDNLGDYHKAIECYESAYRIARAINDKIGQGKWLGSLAGTYRTMGEKEKATRLYTDAIALARRIGDKANECVHLSNLGNAYRTWAEYEKAIKYYDEALLIALEIGDRATQARSLVNAGRVLAKLGKPLEGLEKCRKALDIFTEIGFSSGEAYAHGYIGEVMRAIGKKDDAVKETLEALRIHREIGVQSGQGDWLHNLGRWEDEDGNNEKAISLLVDAYKIRTEIGTAKVADTLDLLVKLGVDMSQTLHEPNNSNS
jgi:tetratricopeptide (TPR) repeat protein